VDLEWNFMFAGDKLEEHIEFGFLEAFVHEAAQKLLQFE